MGQATGFYAGHVKARWGTKEKVPLVSVRALGLQGPDGAYNRIKLVGGALPPTRHPPPLASAPLAPMPRPWDKIQQQLYIGVYLRTQNEIQGQRQ